MSHSVHDAGGQSRRGATRIGVAWRWATRTARLMIGLPDYEAYVAHVLARHPGREPMAREAFFSERLQARYGKGSSRCC